MVTVALPPPLPGSAFRLPTLQITRLPLRSQLPLVAATETKVL